MSIKLISSTNTESPVDLTGFKNHIGFSVADTSRDSQFTVLLQAATDAAQLFTGRQFLPAVYEQRFPDFADKITLDKSPVTGINTVNYFNASNEAVTLTSGTDYFVDIAAEPAEIHFKNTYEVYPYRPDAVVVNFGTGYETSDKVPFSIRAAIMLEAADLYTNPANGVRNMPTAAKNLLRNYRIYNE